MQKDTYDWSFSGLKTAVFRYIQNNKEGYTKERIAAEIQESIADVLVFKTLRVVEKFKPKSLLLAGGVASNNRLKNKFVEKIKQLSFKVDFFIPEPNLCTDNAVYIASYAYFNHKPTHWKQITANPELTITEVKYPNK
jgi:N6-L-threonylcarbamoyladenine synthase